MVLAAIIGITIFILFIRKDPKPPVISCPYCSSRNTRELNFINRISEGGGYVATAGRTHRCFDCRRNF